MEVKRERIGYEKLYPANYWYLFHIFMLYFDLKKSSVRLFLTQLGKQKIYVILLFWYILCRVRCAHTIKVIRKVIKTFNAMSVLFFFCDESATIRVESCTVYTQFLLKPLAYRLTRHFICYDFGVENIFLHQLHDLYLYPIERGFRMVLKFFNKFPTAMQDIAHRNAFKVLCK